MEPSERRVLGMSPLGFHENVYWDWPSPGPDAPCLVMAHGLTRNGRDFDAIARALAPDFHVVCPDVVGRGKSAWLANGALYTYPQYTADAVALIAQVAGPGPVDWLGTSMGGLIGMTLAAMPGSPIRRLILNDIGPFLPEAPLRQIAAYVGQDPHFPDLPAVAAYLKRVHYGFGNLSDADWARMASYSARSLPGGGYRLVYDPGIGSAFTAGPIADVDLWPFWDKITCPVLVLRGANSELLLPETAAEMVRRKPGTILVEFPDCGHAPALLDPDQIAAVRYWLETTVP
jgi:pimeloyl-ACP methyl ester carboxylesterase